MHWLRMNGFADLLDHGVESAVVVSGVVYLADGAVWFVEAVGSFDHVAISCLPLVLHVAGVEVVDSIVIVVVRVSLQRKEELGGS
jgi:hypothetical protein